MTGLWSDGRRMDMRRETKTAVLAGALIVGLLYLACVTWDLLVPRFAMNSAWAPLFPGFTWLTGGAFLLGLVESVLYGALLGWLIAWIPPAVARTVR